MTEIFRCNYNPPPIQSGHSDIAAMAYSQQTQEFIAEQARTSPKRERERQAWLHKHQEDQRKLEKRAKLYPSTYCRKCDQTGCMCPRPIDPNDPEMHPLHNCKGGKHIRLSPVPVTLSRDIGLSSASTNWQVCLDCFELILDGKPTGRKLSTLDAP